MKQKIDIITIPPGTNLVYQHGLDEGIVDAIDVTFYLHEASSLDALMMFSGGNASKCRIKIVMIGSRAHAQIRGAYLLAGDERLELTVLQEHIAPHSESHVVFKGALAGNSYASYAGTVMIGADATRSNASQQNKNILLSPHARALSVPNLEALTNDIQCAHGSAVGQLDAEQLLYLQSRGIGLVRAKKLLLEGFFADSISADCDWEGLVEKLL